MNMASDLQSRLEARGLPPHIAQAFVMNFQDESGLDPAIVEGEPNVHGTRGFGLYQLTGPRRTAYENFAAQRGVAPGDVDAQLDWMMHELQGPERKAAQAIMSAGTTGEAAAEIVTRFLRPAEEHRRRRVAQYLGQPELPVTGRYTAPQNEMATGTPFNPEARNALAEREQPEMPQVVNMLDPRAFQVQARPVNRLKFT